MFSYSHAKYWMMLGALLATTGCRVPWTDVDGETDSGFDTATETLPADTDTTQTGCPGGATDPFDNELAPYIGGEEDIRVVVSIATDFQCPYCLNFAMYLKDLYDTEPYQKYVRLYYHHHPLNMHPLSFDIHAAAAAVALQSMEGFWTLHDEIFLRAQKLPRMTIEEVVEFVDTELDVDMDQFNEDRASKEIADFITYEKQQAVDFGLSGTPSVWVCGEKVGWGSVGDTVEKILSGGTPDTDPPDGGTD